MSSKQINISRKATYEYLKTYTHVGAALKRSVIMVTNVTILFVHTPPINQLSLHK